MADISELDFQNYHNLGLEVASRTIYLGSLSFDEDGDDHGVNGALASQVIKNLHILNQISKEPITVVINCIGGNTYQGLAIYDSIRASQSPITALVLGQADSIASVILQAATERLIAPNAYMTIHYGKTSIEVSSRGMESHGQHEKRINRKMEEIYMNRIKVKNPKYSIKLLREKLDSETILDCHEAVTLGLCDKVVK